MPGAVIVADQSTGAGAGVPGEARDDLWLDQAVALSVGTSGNGSYEWELLDKPLGSAATLSTPTSATSSFTPDLVGTYRVRLVTNGGGAGNIQILVFRVRYSNVGALTKRGWALPAIGETKTEANYGGNTRAWARVLEEIFEDINNELDDLGESLVGRPADVSAPSSGDVYVWSGTEWVPGPAFVPGGDLSGTTTSQVVEAIQGIAVSTTDPSSGDALIFDGTEWAPGPSFVPGGDLSGTATSQVVEAIQGVAVSTTDPSTGDTLVFDGTEWVPGPGFVAGGDLSGTATSQVVEKIQGIAVDTTDPTTGQVLVFDGTKWAPAARLVIPVELPLVAAEGSTSDTTYTRIGFRKIDMSAYPVIPGLTRTVSLVLTLESSDTTVTTQVRLRNVTAAEDVTGTTLTNAAAPSLVLPFEVSAALTVGSSAGNLRSDAAHYYEVQIARSGGTSTDRAICGSARLVITYA